METESNPTESAARSGTQFATTHWSTVLAAGDSASAGSSAALERLCRSYWYPLYAFVRRKGHPPEDAQDLTQAFFARFIEKRFLKGVDRERGRFRTFLLTALSHFLANEWYRVKAAKRGGGCQMISLDSSTLEDRYLAAITHAARYGFLAGRLMLECVDGERRTVLLFAR